VPCDQSETANAAVEQKGLAGYEAMQSRSSSTRQIDQHCRSRWLLALKLAATASRREARRREVRVMRVPDTEAAGCGGEQHANGGRTGRRKRWAMVSTSETIDRVTRTTNSGSVARKWTDVKWGSNHLALTKDTQACTTSSRNISSRRTVRHIDKV